MAVTLTVIGLHQIGASMAWHLRFTRKRIHPPPAHDPATSPGTESIEKKAFDRISANLHDAVRDAQIVVLAVPADQVETT